MKRKLRRILAGTMAVLALGVWVVGTPSSLRAQVTVPLHETPSQDKAPLMTTINHINLKEYEAYIVTSKGEGWTDGKIRGNGAGDQIVFRITVEANGPSSGQFQVRFTGQTAKCLAFEDFFVFNTLEYVSGDFPAVSLAGNPTSSDFPTGEDFGTPKGEWVVTYDIEFEAAGEARIYHILTLSDQAASCTGAPPHSRLVPSGGDIELTGSQKLLVRVE